MGEIVLKKLKDDNPHAPYDEIEIYAAALTNFCEAEENVRNYGIIIAHPRTGVPMDNPYLKIMDTSSRQMLACKRIRHTQGAWDVAKKKWQDKKAAAQSRSDK